MTVAMLPWACKPFVGALSDAVYFLGYSKRFYVSFAAFLSTLVALLLAVIDVDAVSAAGLFTLANGSHDYRFVDGGEIFRTHGNAPMDARKLLPTSGSCA